MAPIPPNQTRFCAPVVRTLWPVETLLTLREVAAVQRVCRATVYRLCERGELAQVRVANSIRVTEGALAEMLRARGHETPSLE